jgi:hydrogenase/urease accessory protein HupE
MSFALAALVGLILSVVFPAMDISLALLISAIVLGVLVACRFSLSLEVSLCISGVTGCLLGMDSLTPDPEWWSTAISIFSLTTGLGIALLIAMGWGDHLRKPWQQVGIRVVGSWIATAALLVLTLNLKPV